MTFRALAPFVFLVPVGLVGRIGQCHQLLVPVVLPDQLVNRLVAFLRLVASHLAEPFAPRAPAGRTVERERVRRRVLVTQPRLGAHEVTAEISDSGSAGGCLRSVLRSVRLSNHHNTVTLRHGFVHGLPQPACIHLRTVAVRFYLQPVHYDFYIMHFVSVHFHSRYHFAHLSVHAYVHESFLAYGFEQFFVMPFAAVDQRCEQQYFLPGVIVYDKVYDLLVRVMNHGLAGQV